MPDVMIDSDGTDFFGVVRSLVVPNEGTHDSHSAYVSWSGPRQTVGSVYPRAARSDRVPEARRTYRSEHLPLLRPTGSASEPEVHPRKSAAPPSAVRRGVASSSVPPPPDGASRRCGGARRVRRFPKDEASLQGVGIPPFDENRNVCLYVGGSGPDTTVMVSLGVVASGKAWGYRVSPGAEATIVAANLFPRRPNLKRAGRRRGVSPDARPVDGGALPSFGSVALRRPRR